MITTVTEPAKYTVRAPAIITATPAMNARLRPPMLPMVPADRTRLATISVYADGIHTRPAGPTCRLRWIADSAATEAVISTKVIITPRHVAVSVRTSLAREVRCLPGVWRGPEWAGSLTGLVMAGEVVTAFPSCL